MDKDGFELLLIEEEEAPNYEFPLPNFPTDDERFSVEIGDTIKLAFHYKDPKRLNEQAISIERMWIEVMENKGSHIVGRLDNEPQYTDLLKSDDSINFHPKHIIAFWAD